ncbi:hypothetical protein IDJ77_12905 [Mucilaginibacter sp. ZT4R22]|uniref:DUF4440 domain-containing protein n=1 Tax=Mucilaginibacter pankratovii TaxID=2772110 RepID=A0ABR7WTX4_9SPHI|nr:hypothetical protein [Mucilaginibacter pankratovii]MBD1364712.1 hypothetical protein [Mucilaginibacter pankratovii]
MLIKLLFGILIAFVLLVVGYVAFFNAFADGFAGHNSDLRDPSCGIHEKGRIFFNREKGLDLQRMIDSFKVLHPKYVIAKESSSFTDLGNVDKCSCCCIDEGEDILFTQSPVEIYRINIQRYRYHAGFEGQYNGDIGYIDIVSTLNNGKWRCAVTSKLDSLEKRRVIKRFNTEVLLRLPIVRDTSSHNDELKL